MNDVLDIQKFDNVFKIFHVYLEDLKIKNGPMCKLWMSIIPWCFAYDRTNYSRYLPWYVHSMKDLQTSNPPVWEYLKDGGFSVQMSTTNTFGRIPMDHLEGFPWIIWKDSHGSSN